MVIQALLFYCLQLLIPPSLLAAGGGEVTQIIVVADTRVVGNGFLRYMADTFNTNPLLFGLWSVTLTSVYAAVLGFLMDWIMSKTGLDVKVRKIFQH